jgi:hypothetical protein
MNRHPRNQSLLAAISETNPFRETLVPAFFGIGNAYDRDIEDMPADLMHLYGAGAPSAATGANQTAIGSLYTDIVNAQIYLQGGTKAVPVWKLLTRAA